MPIAIKYIPFPLIYNSKYCLICGLRLTYVQKIVIWSAKSQFTYLFHNKVQFQLIDDNLLQNNVNIPGPNLEAFKLTLNKWQLDEAHKDKQHKHYSPDFKV